MKIKQRIISALAAAATAFSLMSTTTFAQNLKFDVNNDGKVNVMDAVSILKATAKRDSDLKFDVNDDGKVNVMDAVFLLKYVANSGKNETPETPEKPETTAAESILDDYEKKWCYNLLTDKQKEAYARILEGALKNQEFISLNDLGLSINNKTVLSQAFWACDYDNPQLLNIDGGYSTSYYPSTSIITGMTILYNKTASQTTSALKNIEAKTADIIAQAKTLPNDYEKAKLFHDWIINRTEYIDKGNYVREVDGPIIYGNAVCEGYSKAFAYLCQSVGIECVCISGIANGGGHMWNMVKIDGNWYHADVTWDDPLAPDGKPRLRYDYFLISEAKIKEDHTINDTFKIPTAPSSYAA